MRSTTCPTNCCRCSTTSSSRSTIAIPEEPDLLGLYEGTPHTERFGDELPDVISIYRHALCEMCDDEDDLAEEIYVTVIHEVAHAAGIDDERLHELGWA